MTGLTVLCFIPDRYGISVSQTLGSGVERIHGESRVVGVISSD